MRAGEERVLGVALEVAARERMAVDVDGRREQHVRLLAPRLDAEPLARPRARARGSTSRRARCRTGSRRRPARPLFARAPLGPSVTFSGGMPSRSTPRSVPQVDARDQRRLLVERSARRPASRSRSLMAWNPLPRCGDGTTSTARSRSSPAPAAASVGPSSQRFAGEGMRVVAADIEADALAETVDGLDGDRARFVADVARLRRRRRARRPHVRDVRAVDVLCNNAGVFAGGLMWERPPRDFAWTLGVNLWGILHGDPRVRAAHARGRNAGAHREHGVDGRAVHERVLGPVHRVEVRGARPRPNASRTTCASIGAPIKVSAVVPAAVDTRIGDVGPQPARRRSRRRAPTTRQFVEQALTDLTHDPGRAARRGRGDDRRRDPHRAVPRPDQAELRAADPEPRRRARRTTSCRRCPNFD